MRLEYWEEKLSDYGAGGFYLLESFVLQILKLAAESENKELSIQEGGLRKQFDAFAPNGLSDIPGPLSIEVVYQLSPKSVSSLVNKHHSFSKQPHEKLLIIALRESSGLRGSLNSYLRVDSPDIYFWGRTKIQELIDQFPEQTYKLSSNLFSLRLQSAISKKSENWEETRKEILSEVSEYYNSNRFSIFLGAGVSASAGLPDWNTLLNSLFVNMLIEGEESDKSANNSQLSSIVKRLREVDGPSALMLARYLRRGLSKGSAEEKESFTKKVTEQLYGLRNHRRSEVSPLIREIVALCTPKRSGANVKAVITYNFDDLIERELKSRELNFKSIFEEVDLAGPDELPIYHVHGFLPENRSAYNNLDNSTLVFSEEGYHQIYGDSYHWSNLVQLNNLKENTCLMVGMSMTDPNLRRLLEISAKSITHPKHFVFLPRLNVEQFMEEDGKRIVHAPKEMLKNFIARHHSLNEEVMRELGVKIIWYESHEEIPKLLKRIRTDLIRS